MSLAKKIEDKLEQQVHLPVLTPEEQQEVYSLAEELKDNFHKIQKGRTETEMRVGILTDGRFPTAAAKYWQCVLEQNVVFEGLQSDAFRYRRLEVEIRKKQRALQRCEDDLEREMLEIDLEEMFWNKARLERAASGKVKELKLWSMLKQEQDDGSFDTQEADTHKMEMLQKRLLFQANTLSPHTPSGEVQNVIEQLATANRLLNEAPLLTKEDPLAA
jgi:hypothetical protein